MAPGAGFRALARATAVRAGQEAAAWHLLALRAGIYPGLAVRSAADRAWVDGQLAKRSAYIAAIAEALGLDPDEAIRRWQAGTLTLGDPS